MITIDPWHGPSFDANIADLIENCSPPLEKLSEKCKSAVDEYFEDLPLETSRTTWIALPNRLTYGRVFKSPELDRNRVLQALGERQCRLEDGETVRWDLSEFCHADAFANLSVFLWSCSKYGSPTNPTDYLVDMSQYADREFTEPEHYNRILHKKVVRVLEKHWFSNQCSRHELSEIRFDEEQDQEHYRVLFSIAKRLREVWDEPSNVPETYVLKSLAARFGDNSTALLYSGPSSLAKDNSWTKHMNEMWPWKDAIQRIRGDFLTLDEFFSGTPRTGARLKTGIFMAVSLQKSGLEFDWNWLVTTVCKRRNSEEPNCQSAIEELNPNFEWDQKAELEALAMFESVSQK
ncbi:MAG: hypothetical protein F4Z66_07165, partial [Gammaproteobacteria bacterium]|nr:hypothetical protein [Gammaproteobacteria bacterium]